MHVLLLHHPKLEVIDVVFIPQFVKMVYHIVLFENILHPWNKIHLIMIYDLFNILLDSVC